MSAEAWAKRTSAAPLQESDRIAVVQRVIGQAAAGAGLDGLTRLAARLLDARHAQVRLLAEGQVVASTYGAALPDRQEADRVCSVTVASGKPVVIASGRSASHDRGRSASHDRGRSASHDEGGVAAYLSVPLLSTGQEAGGLVLGALLVVDGAPRTWSPKDLHVLRELSTQVLFELEERAQDAGRAADRVRMEQALTAAEVGRFDLDLTTNELRWDDQLIALFGYDRDSFDPHLDSFMARLHPDDSERVAGAMRRAVENLGEFDEEYRIVLPGGRLRWIDARGRVIQDLLGRPARLLGAARDSTQLRETRDAVARVLETMTDAFYRLDARWRFTYVNAEAERVLRRPRAELVGRSIWVEFSETAGSPLEEQYRQAVRTGEPVRSEFFYTPLDTWFDVRAWPEPDGLSVYFSDISARKAADEQRANALAQAEAANDRLGWLAEASRRLSASLEPVEVLRVLGELVVPELGEWLVVALREEEAAGMLGLRENAPDPDAVRIVQVVHSLPQRRDALEALVTALPLSFTDPHGLGHVMATGTAERLPEVPDEALVALAPDGDSLAAMRALGLKAALTLPLASRGRTFGALTIAEPPGGKPDQALLADLGTRAASALDNALLFGEQRRIGLTLQRSLLPQEFVQLPGIVVATRYLPATEGALAGGDFHQVLQVGRRLLVALGDVAGHGMQSAARMGQLRAIVGALALEGHEPAALLTRLSVSVDGLMDLPLATLLVGLYDRETRRMQFSTAGHPPPLLAPLDGEPRFADLEPGPPIGAGAFDYEQREMAIPGGATTVLYSDGLIERRGEGLSAGLERLRQALVEVRLPPERVCSHVLRKLGRDGGGEDDVALLVLAHRRG